MRKNVDKLAEKFEQVNINLSQVVTESQNSFLSSKVHVVSLNLDACLHNAIAMDAYSDYKNAVQELAEVEELIFNDLLERSESLNRKADLCFTRVV